MSIQTSFRRCAALVAAAAAIACVVVSRPAAAQSQKEKVPTAPAEPSYEPEPALPSPETFAALPGDTFAALDTSNVGYIDSALPQTQWRLRYDAAYDNPTPDRAEFFYPKCGCFRGVNDPNAKGPPLPETNVDYQDIRAYFEYATGPRFSAFVELPVRFLNPEANDNTTGLGDIEAGFKYAAIANPCSYLTFQFKVYAPSGDADRGLGTGHASLEPGILYFRRLSERLTLEAELRDWIPISDSIDTETGQDFAGNVLRWGAGLGYDLYHCDDGCCSQRLTLVGEVVGWSVLDGLVTDLSQPTGTRDVGGETTVNGKLGLRWSSGDYSLYAGAGTAFTDDVWYEDIIRIELRRVF